jgi:hypothetical protein
LNTFLRQFVENSIKDWVGFIKGFTYPNYDKGEMWKVNTSAMITIHISIHMFDKKKKAEEDKKKKKKSKDEEIVVEAE